MSVDDEIIAETDVDADIIENGNAEKHDTTDVTTAEVSTIATGVTTAEVSTIATAEAAQDVQVDMEAGDFARSVLAEIETTSEEVRVKFEA